MKMVLLLAAFVITINSLLPKNVYARSGCCSHHGGVCGCSCCDGRPLSSTCAPYYPACSQPAYVAPVATKVPVPTNTPKPPTPKPTILPTLIPTLIPTVRPTQTPTLIPTVTPTSLPTLEPEVKSASTEVTLTPTTQPEKTEVNSKDILLGFGILSAIAVGSIWIIREILKKIMSVFKK